MIPAVFGGLWVGAAVVLKLHFRTASPESVRWILGPVAALVGWGTGTPFLWEDGVGFVSAELRYAIVPACAGINFLAASGLMLGLGSLGRSTTWGEALRRATSAAALALAGTILANAARILVSLPFRTLPGVSQGLVHHGLGVVVYVVTLGIMAALLRGQLSRWARNPGWPLATYLAVVVGIPLLRGEGAHAAYWSHAVRVVVVSAVLGGLALLAQNRRAPSWRRPT